MSILVVVHFLVALDSFLVGSVVGSTAVEEWAAPQWREPTNSDQTQHSGVLDRAIGTQWQRADREVHTGDSLIATEVVTD